MFLIESDDSNSLDDLYGTGSATQGDYVTGTAYPIIDNGQEIFADYGGAYYPYIVTICPNGAWQESGQSSYVDHVAILETCPDLCDPIIEGCTDSTASNYDPNATVDDGTCDNGNDNANDTTEVITNFAGSCPSSCDWLVDFGSQPLGTSWGLSLIHI